MRRTALRNVYRTDNKIGRALKGALANAPKILLTATPLQNSLMELYGLVSLIDDYAFGDAKSFRAQYARLTGDALFDELKSPPLADLPSHAAAAGAGIYPLHQPNPDHPGIPSRPRTSRRSTTWSRTISAGRACKRSRPVSAA